MRIIIQQTTGGPETLRVEDRPIPKPKPGEVLVKVAAAGINPVDRLVSRGLYPLLGEPPFTVGWDIAGQVAELGPDVTEFEIGDRVFGMPRFPPEVAAYAEYVVSPAVDLVETPERLSDVEAASMPLAGLTAWQALVHETGVKPGDKVLVQAAAGGVGHLAVQIAKALGAHVTASASAGKHDYLRSIGADTVVDLSKNAAAAGDGFDIVFDPISGANAEASLNLLRPGGSLAALLDASDEAMRIAQAQGKPLRRISVRASGEDMASLANLVKTGQLKPYIAKTFLLEDAGEAQEFLTTKPIGKIVLTI